VDVSTEEFLGMVLQDVARLQEFTEAFRQEAIDEGYVLGYDDGAAGRPMRVEEND
jgi:hypothetical protein